MLYFSLVFILLSVFSRAEDTDTKQDMCIRDHLAPGNQPSPVPAVCEFLSSMPSLEKQEHLTKINQELATGKIVPKPATQSLYIPQLSDKIKKKEQVCGFGERSFLENFVKEANVYQPLGDWNSSTIPHRGMMEGFIDEPYRYIYASIHLENRVVLTMKIKGIRTNHYYDLDELRLIEQGKDWEDSYSKQESYDVINNPVDGGGAPYHKHYFPLAKPREYLQAVLLSDTEDHLDRDPRNLNDVILVYTQNEKSVFVGNNWDRGLLKRHLSWKSPEYVITGVH